MSDGDLILKEWLRNKLTDILNFSVPDDMINVILGMSTDNELVNYLKDLLDVKDSRTRPLIDELIKRRRIRNCQPIVKKKTDGIEEKYQVNNKKNKIVSENALGFEKLDKTVVNASSGHENQKKKNKYKTAYVPVAASDTVLRKGRYQCNCEAKEHNLINNCLTCGRIVCEQEGSGPCYFCNTLVCTPEEMAQFNNDTGQGTKLYEKLLTKEKPKGLDEALKHRDRLLEFDKNTEKHTHVFDDDSEYFCATNPWLTLEERDFEKKKEEEYFNKKHESRRNKKVTLTFQGNKVIQEETKEDVHNHVRNERIPNNNLKPPPPVEPKQEDIDYLIDPFFADISMKFKKLLKPEYSKQQLNVNTSFSRIMDAEIQQLADAGNCLSIHQPWASFMMHGIKNAEGRTWYTPYRGRLWIASTCLRVSRDDIEKHQNVYRLIKGEIKLPAEYPAGCLLGCVELVDCLTQEQYRVEYPDGEIEDPYVFIFENPRLLPVRYPVKGKRNIYKLDEKIHKVAATCLKTTGRIMSKSEYKVKYLRP